MLSVHNHLLSAIKYLYAANIQKGLSQELCNSPKYSITSMHCRSPTVSIMPADVGATLSRCQTYVEAELPRKAGVFKRKQPAAAKMAAADKNLDSLFRIHRVYLLSVSFKPDQPQNC